MTATPHSFAITCALLLAVACATPEEQPPPQPERTSPNWPRGDKESQALLERLNAVKVSNNGLQAVIWPRHGWHVRCDLAGGDDLLVVFGVGETESAERLVGAWGDEGAAKDYSASLDKVTASGDFLAQLNTGDEPMPVWLTARRAAGDGEQLSPIAWRAAQPAEGFQAAYTFEFESMAGVEAPQVTLHVRDLLLINIRM